MQTIIEWYDIKDCYPLIDTNVFIKWKDREGDKYFGIGRYLLIKSRNNIQRWIIHSFDSYPADPIKFSFYKHSGDYQILTWANFGSIGEPE